MKKLTKEEMKKVFGGLKDDGDGNMCNAYCGQGSGQQCDKVCPYCVKAGNGQGTGPGQDKFCASHPDNDMV